MNCSVTIILTNTRILPLVFRWGVREVRVDVGGFLGWSVGYCEVWVGVVSIGS